MRATFVADQVVNKLLWCDSQEWAKWRNIPRKF